MFLLSAFYIEDSFRQLREEAIRIGEETGVLCPLKVLPMHISIRKSVDLGSNSMDDVVRAICDYYSSVEPFSVDVEGFELGEGIIWLRMKENAKLREIHNHMVDMMQSRFSIEPHELDPVFIFHSTVFMDSRADLKPAFERISEIPLPKTIRIRNFMIGTSENGIPETYRIYKHYRLGPDVSVGDRWEDLVSGRDNS